MHVENDERQQLKIVSEIMALKKLEDLDEVVKLKAAGFNIQGFLFIVMEYVEGEELLKYCQKSSPSGLFYKMLLLERIAAAIAKIHDKNIFHRDLKPGNIIIRKGQTTVAVIRQKYQKLE